MSNKQVILREYVTGFPKESDLYVSSTATIKLKLSEPEHEGSSNKLVLVKNLYLSCDPYQRLLMERIEGLSSQPNSSFTPGSVSKTHHISFPFNFCKYIYQMLASTSAMSTNNCD